MTDFDTYARARAYAQSLANDLGRRLPEQTRAGRCDLGLERMGDSWRVFRLPSPKYRAGGELSCEVVMSEVNRF